MTNKVVGLRAGNLILNKRFFENRIEKKREAGNQKPRFAAKKSLGQNFLSDENYVSKIVDALDAKSGETIVEIGAGRGELTRHLIATGANVIAIELDRNLAPFLRAEFGASENFSVIEEDALEIDFNRLLLAYSNLQIPKPKSQIQNPNHARLIANLPYYISTAILQRLITQRNCFLELILMFQKEVVERITAQPSESERGFLSVLIEAYFESEKLFDVPPKAFQPIPKVWSAVIRLTPKRESGIHDEKLFREIVSCGFAHKRKTILNNLKYANENLLPLIDLHGGAEKFLVDCEIKTNRRAESLSLDEWIRMANLLAGSAS